jgi:hypothetical protein
MRTSGYELEPQGQQSSMHSGSDSNTEHYISFFMLPPTSVFCFVAEDSLFFTCLRSEADCRAEPGLLLVGIGSLLFSGDDLSESDALPLADPDLDDPEEL